MMKELPFSSGIAISGPAEINTGEHPERKSNAADNALRRVGAALFIAVWSRKAEDLNRPMRLVLRTS
ncbi:hypothetical protein JYK14_17750 [Siccirubricoccus sp. KC 17139]|uniref:Uncharacterized protein n=1 Tax=Siccirubricoccus soli TaxID=2899147 RepID=A0ABT1DAI4_9PROT|nr:hypothetical protein [Siccirubricoccus soli]MCO6417990.1 hypothetical protein [Siccirubricoccus soli]MCP2684125.1 hypothetical protein [Siccirubricoccus soli]